MGLGSGIGSIVSGLINSGRSLPTIDLGPIFAEIDRAGAQRSTLINNLPAELQKEYAKYKASNTAASEGLETRTKDIGQTLLERTQGLYGPDSPAVQATLNALKTKTYSTLPGTLDELRANLAATGGLGRGGASRAITQAVLQPASTFAQQSQDVLANQLQTQQQAVQSAYNKIAQLDDATAQSLFGMSTTEAANILQFGRQDLQQQLADLINNINTVSGQKLGAQGIAANNAYQNAVTRNAQQNALTNDIFSTVGGLGESSFTGGGGNLDFNALSNQGLVSTPPPGYDMSTLPLPK